MSTYFINQPSNILPVSLTTAILAGSNALSFHQSLPDYRPSPVHHLPALAQQLGIGSIHVKDESSRFGLNAFKVLGASYAIAEILKKHPGIQTFCTATDGNHGRAVAWAARQAGKEAVVYVPQHTSPGRIRAIELEGAQVIKVNSDYDETCAQAEVAGKKEGWQLVQDAAWKWYEEIPATIMAGYLSHFMEMENHLHSLPQPAVDIVFLQAGVGSWAAAAVWYYLHRYKLNRPKLVIVEPATAAGILYSFQQGSRQKPTGSFETIMAGLNCGIPSLSAWQILKTGANAVIAIEDHYAKQAMKTFYAPGGNDPLIVSGESGAAGLGALLALLHEQAYEPLKKHLNITQASRVLLFNTEGATDPEMYKSIIEGPLY
jgi:diaminopropionate ammonia-lyase